jgi:hypothetical protein
MGQLVPLQPGRAVMDRGWVDEGGNGDRAQLCDVLVGGLFSRYFAVTLFCFHVILAVSLFWQSRYFAVNKPINDSQCDPSMYVTNRTPGSGNPACWT